MKSLAQCQVRRLSLLFALLRNLGEFENGLGVSRSQSNLSLTITINFANNKAHCGSVAANLRHFLCHDDRSGIYINKSADKDPVSLAEQTNLHPINKLCIFRLLSCNLSYSYCDEINILWMQILITY